MLIHVVERGDSLYSIANRYQASADELIMINQLETPNDLVVGQTLVILNDEYTVQAGDSFYSIGQKLNIPFEELAEYNDLNYNEPLMIGQVLSIPQPSKTTISTNAYVEPFGDTVSDQLIESAMNRTPLLTYLGLFSYEVNDDGTLTPPPIEPLPEIASENQTALMMVITNLRDGSFDQELGRRILTNQQVQDELFNQIIATANEVGYQDIHFDFEFLPTDMREAYNQFLQTAKDRLSPEGLMISTALAPKTSAEQTGAWYEAHDYAAHGDIVDFVVLMTYEWGYSGGPAMAVSPIGPVTDVVEYALTEIPADKIMLGQNTYGYDWTLPYEEGGDPAQAISPNQGIQLANEYNQAIEFDEEAQAPYFYYWDEDGNQHEVWFEDARSIQAKFDLIKEKGLRGISYWKLGLAFPQNWALLDHEFNIRKLN
ncbi:glycosyl hydrolase family 18 protein [Alkalibacillus almallahensis]|uniref:glycosyl hydrolase family 18 protein n=1 Tax=Alkalibacillus almallahensis TaxID=1379154 RepID=UPI001423825A|nr:glycoside hydrolase family 18 protein [Alkalibacillus almallahensis]NIK12738.1 spore germination protein [Alkalibacillus almallahensis]